MSLLFTWIHLFLFHLHLISFILWIQTIYEFIYFCLNSFDFIYSTNSLGVDTMAPKDAKKHMNAEQNKKRKLQTTSEPSPCKTVSNCAPSSNHKCSMHIKIFVSANNLFYLSKSINLNHCHHPHLKSEAILCGQSNMLLVTLIFWCFYLVWMWWHPLKFPR